ncbi:ankyrin repeat domain-containing protein [Peredibacter starrii]|uniref:Ankyrin repeat domain-containing protein n=1 Tax=Peredibacter starrii TaxID=28202 RepID=A0AAX4HJT5_9BACT|nr:ankyrin repeat domain-containing protein [Peredibacter starrii]WPU63279.1 ankyrin repeat domain-containing protein [Peredibacter starrii]
MLKSVQLAVLSSVLLSVGAQARVIYGDDNRVEVYQASPLMQRLARSSATAVAKTDIIRNLFRPGMVQLKQKTLQDWLSSADKNNRSKSLFTEKARNGAKSGARFCDGERFTDQPNPGMCSGFLIAPDLLVTAGHCATEENFCEEYDWVFDFKVDPSTKKAGLDIREEDVYRCKRVVSSSLNMDLGLDYGIIQLDRMVKGRAALNIRTDGQVFDFTNVTVIGSPSGLPQKVSGGAVVRKNTHPFYFTTNLDAFQGNSGAPVFNTKTGLVEGILVRGEEDFVLNYQKMCVSANRCKDNECRGEDVSRMTSIPEIGVMDVLFKSAKEGDLETLKNILKLNFWIDIYGRDRKSALIQAATSNQHEVMKVLIEKGADVNLQDIEGNTALHSFAKVLTERNNDVLNKMLAQKADLNLVNANGDSALLMAAKARNLAGVKLLIAAGAYANSVDANGESVLFTFARLGLTNVVNELADLGVNSAVKNATGETALDLLKK